MTPTNRFPWPQRTTFTAGLLFVVSGVLQLSNTAGFGLPITETFVISLSNPVLAFAAALAEAAAFVIAAIGIAGEIGIAGPAPWGRIALIVFGVRNVLFAALPVVPLDAPLGEAQGYICSTVSLLFAVAGVVGAIAVVRARVLSGVARWVLLPVAVIECALVLAFSWPLLPVDVVLAIPADPIRFTGPALTLLLAASLLLWGRFEAVKHRARVIRDAW
jgi:hypothetical protein